jgi:hypothetical protein
MAVSRTRGRADRETATAPPRSDAYTGLVAISLVAMITASVLLFLDYNQYPKKKPDPPPAPSAVKPQAPQAGSGAPAPAPTSGAGAGQPAEKPLVPR